MTFRLLSALGLLACLSPLPAQAFVLTGVVTLHSLDGFWNDNAAALETLFGPIPSYELRFEIDPEDLVYESFFNTTLTDGGAFRLHQSADLRLEATGFALSGTSLSSRTQDQRSTSGSTGDLVALDPGLIESLDAPLPAFDLYLASLGQTRTMTAFSDFDLALNFQPMGAVGDVFEGADLETALASFAAGADDLYAQLEFTGIWSGGEMGFRFHGDITQLTLTPTPAAAIPLPATAPLALAALGALARLRRHRAR